MWTDSRHTQYFVQLLWSLLCCFTWVQVAPTLQHTLDGALVASFDDCCDKRGSEHRVAPPHAAPRDAPCPLDSATRDCATGCDDCACCSAAHMAFFKPALPVFAVASSRQEVVALPWRAGDEALLTIWRPPASALLI